MVAPVHSLLLLLFLAFDLVNTRYVDDVLLNGRSTFTKETLDRFMENMDKLDKIQSRIFGITHSSIRDRIVVINETTMSMERPDQLPYLFEGDIILTDAQMQAVIRYAEEQLAAMQGKKMESRSPSVKTMISNLAMRWTTMPIPFTIDSNVDRNAVLAGIRLWQDVTCITFKEVSGTSGHGSMLQFIKGNGCYSNIGRVSQGAQQISIGNGCTSLGTVAHEIGHALGFFHEQSRYDRDSYVRILPQNMQSGYASQFSKQPPSSMVTYGVRYDYGSVMHYPQSGFSANGLNTIETLDPNYQNTIGQRAGLSFSDIKKMNFAYCNGSCKSPLPCQNGGYTDPKNCAQCRCPTGLGGTVCDRAAQTSTNCGTLDRSATSSFQTLSQSGQGSCNFMITAPSGRKVLIQFDSFRFSKQVPCTSTYLEVVYASDVSSTGARFCSSKPGQIVSQTNKMIILYRGSSQTSFSLRYSYYPATLAGIQTTSAMVAPTTPMKRPTESPPTEPPFARQTRRPPTEWSECSAECGGCGIQTRRTFTVDEEEVREARYCNTRACPNRRCCRPFVYTRGGKCVRPYNEDEVAVDPNTETRTLPPMPEGGVKRNLTGRPHKKLIVVSTHSRLNKEVTDNGSAEEAEEFEDEDLAGLRSGEGERDDPFYYYYYYYYYDEKEQKNKNL